jgi:hypothetical protein
MQRQYSWYIRRHSSQSQLHLHSNGFGQFGVPTFRLSLPFIHPMRPVGSIHDAIHRNVGVIGWCRDPEIE